MADEPISLRAAMFRAWLRLEDYEADHPERLVASVLGLRTSRPKASIEELAREFAGTANSPFPAQRFRKILQVARREFFEALREMGYGGP